MLVSAVWLAPALLAVVDAVAQRRLSGDPPATPTELIFAGGDWLVYALLTPIVFAIAARWPVARPQLARRIALHLGIALLFCVAWALGGTTLQFLLRRLFDPAGFHKLVAAGGSAFWRRVGVESLSWIFTTLPFGVVVYLTVAGTEHAIRYFVEARDREVQLARLSERLATSRFAALQAQVNPHFLFNTLNTIAVLIRDDDRRAAVRIVEQLSDLLRRTLNRHRANEVRLDDELELVRQYLAIERARFSDRLSPVLDVDGGLEAAAVPGFALQHLVENAVRHGIARSAEGGRVILRVRRRGDRLVISVADDGGGLRPETEFAPGHGISQTRERLQALYGDRASLEVSNRPEGGVSAVLTLPYRELPPEPDVAAP